jgi:hypothetical protein
MERVGPQIMAAAILQAASSSTPQHLDAPLKAVQDPSGIPHATKYSRIWKKARDGPDCARPASGVIENHHTGSVLIRIVRLGDSSKNILPLLHMAASFAPLMLFIRAANIE